MMKAGAVVVNRLRKDAKLFDLPEPVKNRGKGRPRKYGQQRLSLAHRGIHRLGWTTLPMVLYGVEQPVAFKTFLATYPPAGGMIRVVIVKLFGDNSQEWVAFFCTDSTVSASTIIEPVADRSDIEQNFHDVKDVHGAGQQQVRNVWCNVVYWNLCLWLQTIVELWSWRRSGKTLKQRSDRPWNDADRRPSHADRVKTLKKQALREAFFMVSQPQRAARKILSLVNALIQLAT